MQVGIALERSILSSTPIPRSQPLFHSQLPVNMDHHYDDPNPVWADSAVVAASVGAFDMVTIVPVVLLVFVCTVFDQNWPVRCLGKASVASAGLFPVT